MIDDCSVIVSSCDDYLPLMDGFFKLFKKYSGWTSKTIFSTLTGNHLFSGYEIIGIEKSADDSFSTRLIKCLKKIKTKYIVFFLDDFFLTNKVNSTYIDDALKIIKSDSKIGNIILHDGINKDLILESKYNDFYLMKKNADYRITTQVSIWRKSYLRKVLRRGESAWQFEIIGSYRASFYKEKTLICKPNCYEYINYPTGGIVYRGRIQSERVDFLAKEEIDVPILPAPVFSTKQKIISEKWYWRLSVFLRHIKRK